MYFPIAFACLHRVSSRRQTAFLLQPAWVAAASLQQALAAAGDRTSTCTCDGDVQKRLALASAVAKQHIALGLAPRHTLALRGSPSHGGQQKVSKLSSCPTLAPTSQACNAAA